MFNIFKKHTPKLTNYASLEVDLHSHLLPGIDDGAKTLEDSIELIKRLETLGFKELITTPHIMADLYPNTPEIIQAKLKEVRAAVKKEGIQINISAAAEYLMDEAFGDKIEKGNLLTLPGNRVLVEMSFISPPQSWRTTCFSYRPKAIALYWRTRSATSFTGGNSKNIRS
jgi:protein-tyrosine phosphatase